MAGFVLIRLLLVFDIFAVYSYGLAPIRSQYKVVALEVNHGKQKNKQI